MHQDKNMSKKMEWSTIIQGRDKLENKVASNGQCQCTINKYVKWFINTHGNECEVIFFIFFYLLSSPCKVCDSWKIITHTVVQVKLYALQARCDKSGITHSTHIRPLLQWLTNPYFVFVIQVGARARSRKSVCLCFVSPAANSFFAFCEQFATLHAKVGFRKYARRGIARALFINVTHVLHLNCS